MSYLVLARKYRPQTFSDIIGQQHIVTTIKNAIRSGKIWHAYIFAGMRGTGKTTTARVLAKALNCANLTNEIEPCNSCKNCIDITQGSSIDVIEIDAASNRGIDDIRALRETVKYVPANSKYKVYIIDEAHQITDAAFNAFLKTLEEPPSYVVFILATTEFNSLPLTIISRCQVFKFKPIPSNVILERLKYILEKEAKSQKITEDALKLIAESSGGSVRDALSLLDQILSYTETHNTIDYNIVREILGITPVEIIEKYVELIIYSDIKKILNFVNEIYYSGIDFFQLSKDLLEFFRNLLYLKNGVPYESSFSFANKFKDKFSTTHLVACIQQLIRLSEEIKRAEYPKVLFELYTIKLTQQYIDLNEILKKLNETNLQPQLPETSQTLHSSNQQPNTITQKEETKEEVRKEQIEPKPQTKNFEDIWEEFLEIIRKEKPLSYPILASSEVVFNNDTITIYLPNKYTKVVLESHNLTTTKILQQLLNKEVKIVYDVKQNKLVFGESQTPTSTSPLENFVVIKPKKQIDPTVEKLRSAFSGKIIEKQKTQQTPEDSEN
ncbi:MAG: DNA polymerase III subunit gamma/tau [Elusimicrobiota bacterium]|nr:DNA polymerase III subunit gamma/tau [Endomicrobiia bacterium]MDW8166248.1 DNA polymerase III subunit gamma/tau [Elusimicrobiota bacterium]